VLLLKDKLQLPFYVRRIKEMPPRVAKRRGALLRHGEVRSLEAVKHPYQHATALLQLARERSAISL
jgi:hypothetical protein